MIRASATAGSLAFLLAGCGLADAPSKAAHVAASPKDYLPSTVISSAADDMQTADGVRFAIDSWVSLGEEQSGVRAEGAMDLTSGAFTIKQNVRARWNGPEETLRQTVVKDRVYLQVPGQKTWLRFTPGQAREVGMDSTGSHPAAIPDLLVLVKDKARRAGTETVNGVTTTRYNGRIDADEISGDGNAWAGLAEAGLTSLTFTIQLSEDRLPVRVVVNASGRDSGSLALTATYTEWGKPVRIRPPKRSVSAAESGVLDELRRQIEEEGEGGGDGFTV